MTNFSFGRTDGRTERGNNNIPELSLESAGIISFVSSLLIVQNSDQKIERVE